MRVVKPESGGAVAEHCTVMTGLPLDAATIVWCVFGLWVLAHILDDC